MIIVNLDENLNEIEMSVDEIQAFKNKLNAGIVNFKFIKKDGSLRKARGTMNPAYLPPPPPKTQYNTEKLRRVNRPANIIVFFDLDNDGFRSFDSNRFDGYID